MSKAIQKPNNKSGLGWPPLLAIDIGQQMGYAVRTQNGEIKSGSRPLKHRNIGARTLKMRQFLYEIYNESPTLETIYYEDVQFQRSRKVNPAYSYAGFMGEIQAFCVLKKLRCVPVQIKSIKKHATGNANAGKPAVIAAVESWGHSPYDDNEADAIAMLDLMITKRGDK